MTEASDLAKYASKANAVFNSITANATAITALSVGGAIEVVRGTGDAYIDLKNTDAEDFDVRLQSIGTGGVFGVQTAGSERMRVDAGGNTAIGTTTTTSGRLRVDATGGGTYGRASPNIYL